MELLVSEAVLYTLSAKYKYDRLMALFKQNGKKFNDTVFLREYTNFGRNLRNHDSDVYVPVEDSLIWIPMYFAVNKYCKLVVVYNKCLYS